MLSFYRAALILSLPSNRTVAQKDAIHFILICIRACLYTYMHMHVQFPQSRADMGSPGAGVTGNYELLDVEAETQTQVLQRNSNCC